MRPQTIEEHSLYQDELNEHSRFGFGHHQKNQKKQVVSTFQNIITDIKNCTQKGVLTVIIVLICCLLLFSSISGNSNKNEESQALSQSFYIDKLLKSIQPQDAPQDDENPLLKTAKANNITKNQIQNAIKFTQILTSIKAQNEQTTKSITVLQQADFQQLQTKYNLKGYNQNPLTFCIVLPSLQQNLQGKSIAILKSIIAQNYTNYKIIYARNSSTTPSLIESYLENQKFPKDRSLRIQKSTQKILQNIYFGVKQHCFPGQVVLFINKAESLIGTNILSLYNAAMQSKNVAVLYSQFLKINQSDSSVKLGDFKGIKLFYDKTKSFKNFQFQNQFPIISFYVDVFLQIPIESFIDQNEKFYAFSWETALFKPLFELSTTRTLYLNEITFYVDSLRFETSLKSSIQEIKQFQKVSNNEVLKQLQNFDFIISSKEILEKKDEKKDKDSDKTKEIPKNELKSQMINDLQNEEIKPIDTSKDIQNELLINENKENMVQENDQKLPENDIFEKHKNEDDLKEPVLANPYENDRDPLSSPAIVKPISQKGEHFEEIQKSAMKQVNKNSNRPQQELNSQVSKEKIDLKITEEVIIDGKISVKTKEVLPIDEFGGFLQIQDEQMEEIKTPNPEKKIIRKPYNVQGKLQVKGPNYTFNASFEQMVNNADLQKIFGKRKSKEGIWKAQLFEAIQKLEITNNVKYGGQIQADMTKFDSDKFQKIKRVTQLIQNQADYLQTNYKISEFKKKQLPFCIVVPSHENVQSGLYLRNLNSIFMQDYNNYHIVYIDDASSDKTGEYVKSYVMSRSIPLEKIEIITNKENRKPPYNIYNAITNHCKLGQLALIIEGDDALIGTNVLNLYNAIYQRDKCAMIYSSYLQIFENSKVELGVGHQIMDEYFQKNSIRTIFEIPGKYLLSFYVDVFKSIKNEQFRDPKGYFFWFAYDRALITPLLQVSYPRIKIVKQILYEHRRDANKKQYINDWNRQSGEILAKKPYKPLKFFPFIERNKYKYFIDGPVEKVVENSDFDAYTFINNFQKEGISKDSHQRAIRLTQVIHNVNYNGQIVVQLAEYDNSKEEKQKRIQKLLEEDKKYLNQKYRIDFYRNEELPFCIITPSYNNVKSGLYLRNLDSVFMQDYKNYHVVYIDDCSPDKTGEFVKKYLEEKNIPKKHIEVIINRENKKALYNIHLGIHKYCKSGEIVAIIDGDDSFIGRNILALFNAVYQRDKAAMAYSNFLTIHNNDRTELGFCHEIDREMFEQNTFRNSWDLLGTHLMTFYSDLFKRIKISDLTYSNGTFFDYAYDRAILTPLLQMAYPRIVAVKEITYEYRNDTGINDAPDDWIRVSHMILGKKPYAHLSDYPFIKGLIVSTDKFNIKAQIQTVIKNTDFSVYEQSKNRKITGIAKEQHIHAIRLTQLVHNINFEGSVDISLKSNKNIEKKKQRLQKLLKNDKEYLETKYNLSNYKEKQLPFCIVVSSFKSLQNGLYLRNLDSIMMQDYKNYRIVYIDDNSPSESQEYLKKYLEEEQIPLNVLKIIRNEQTLKDLSNIYYAAHNECQLNEIMVVIGENDALIGRNVLSVLNALYQKEKAVIGFTCFLKVYNSSSQLGKCTDFSQFYFRTKTFRNHLQFEKYRLMSFYTHLFRRIKIKDLTFENGTFFNNAIDKAIMIPLIEMSYPNVLIVKEIMYEDRYDKESRDLLQEGTETNIILSKNPYEKVDEFQLQ